MSDNENARITRLEVRIAKLCGLIEGKLESTEGRLDRLEARVDGPDDEPEKGITVKLDRAIGTLRLQSRVLWLVVGVVGAEGARFLLSMVG